MAEPRQHKGTSTQDKWQSHVLPHGAIEELAPNFWHVTGTLPSSTMVPREMVLYRLADSSLLIHSAIALDEPGMALLEYDGTPKILVVPNRIHRLDAGVYKQRYPQQLDCLPSSSQTICRTSGGGRWNRRGSFTWIRNYLSRTRWYPSARTRL